MKYNHKDTSIVIPTYNRSNDLKIVLGSIMALSKKPREIIVTDQSEDQKVKNLCKKYKLVKYIRSSPPSITIARNVGIKNASKHSKIIVFLDDDVTLDKDYLEKILEVYNMYPNAKGVSGFWSARGLLNFNKWPVWKKIFFYIEQQIKRLFLIGYFEKDKIKIKGPFCNTYPISSNKIIHAEWLKGMNMSYKREVFQKVKFDENLLGYTVVEDIGFSYSVNNFFQNSLYTTPFAKIEHRFSQKERYDFYKMMYINMVDHFYLFYKMFNKSSKEKIKFVWSLFGIFLLRLFLLLTFKNKNYLKFRYFTTSLLYCIKNKTKIKKGILRDF